MYKDDGYYDKFLGILYVSSELSKRIRRKFDNKLNQIHEKYEELAGKEFEKFMFDNNLEINMGMVSEKEIK